MVVFPRWDVGTKCLFPILWMGCSTKSDGVVQVCVPILWMGCGSMCVTLCMCPSHLVDGVFPSVCSHLVDGVWCMNIYMCVHSKRKRKSAAYTHVHALKEKDSKALICFVIMYGVTMTKEKEPAWPRYEPGSRVDHIN